MGILDFLKGKKASSPATSGAPVPSVKSECPSPPIQTAQKPAPSAGKTPPAKVTASLAQAPAAPQPVDLNDLLKSASKSKHGLYPHELLMLAYAEKFSTNPRSNSFQSFWLYQYGVKDPSAILQSLDERGFIEKGSIRKTIESLKLPAIKEELKGLKEKQTGKKAELVERLLSAAPDGYLEQKYPDRTYALTPLGQEELEQNDYVLYLHRHSGYGISIWDMNRQLAYNQKGFSYRDLIWQHLNKESLNNIRNFDYGFYRNTRLNMYQFLMEEKKSDDAFLLLCEVVLYDLSGLGNGEGPFQSSHGKRFLLEQELESCFPYDSSIATILPAVAGWLKDYQEKKALSEAEFRALLLKNFRRFSLPRKIFSQEECVEIVMAEMAEELEKLKKLYQKGKSRVKKQLLELSE